MLFDYLLIGQGAAGSFLAWELLRRGNRIMIVDDNHTQSSSIVSAGIINPISGQRFISLEGFDTFFSYACKVYEEMEIIFGSSFIELKPVVRIFQNETERDHWLQKDKSDQVLAYAKSVHPAGTFHSVLHDPHGSLTVEPSAQVKSAPLLKALRDYFKAKGILIQQRFSHDDLLFHDGKIGFSGETFREVIFCEGYQAQKNPWFNWLPFNSVKGEILEVEMNRAGLPDGIINKGKWCAPIDGERWMCGSTYNRDVLDCQPTPEGRKEILDHLNQIFCRDIRVLDHKAGVRPAMMDQRGVLGRHPQKKNLLIFNGLGSKGFLTAPLYAAQLCDYMQGKSNIPTEISIDRFDYKNGGE